MNSSTVESKQWTSHQGSSTVEEPEFVAHPYDHAVESHLLTKHRCDDAVSSSATHGSVSTSGTSKRQSSTCHTDDTMARSNGKATSEGGGQKSTLKCSPELLDRTHMFNGKVFPTNCGSSEDRTFCLDRFLGDIDPREKIRLGDIDGGARGRSRERRNDGAGRPRVRPLKSKEGRCDKLRVVKERGEEQEKDGAA